MVNFKSSGDKGTAGKSGKFQFDCDGCILFTRRSIKITNSFSFSLYNLSFFILFFAAELSIILQRLILLHRSLRFNDRNSIIDCNFGNTWRVFGVKIDMSTKWVRTKHGPGVHGPPLWTGSMDHFHGPGQWTPCHGPGPWTNFFNNEKWTKTEIVQK